MRYKIKNAELYLPLIVFFVLMVMVAGLWYYNSYFDRIDIKKRLQIATINTASTFSSMAQNDIGDLRRLGERMEFTDGLFYEYWEDDAKLIIDENVSFRFIEWIDNNMVIRKIVPPNESFEIVGTNLLSLGRRSEGWKRHVLDSTPNLSGWTDLAEGGQAFLVDIPVFFKGSFQGTITGALDFSEGFRQYAIALNDYNIRLTDRGREFFVYNPNNEVVPDEDLVLSYEILRNQPNEPPFLLTMYPNKSYLDKSKDETEKYTLLLGSLLSFLVSLLVYYYIKAKKESHKVRLANINLKRTNLRLSHERTRAEKASNAKTEFISNMSHEIRTPLNAIIGFIEILKNSRHPEEVSREYIELMDSASSNLLALVDDILDFNRIESRKLKIHNTSFNPAREIQRLVTIYGPDYSNKGLYLKAHIEGSDVLMVYGDKIKYIQIITNFIKNALKFTNKGGVDIFYNAREEGGILQIDVIVRDTGIGMPKDKVKKIFSRFTQLDTGYAKKHEGSGLGLAISKHLTQLLGGKISAKSEEGVGSEFTVSLPFKVHKTQLVKVKQETLDHAHFDNLNVLVVDDNKINKLVLKKLLEQFDIYADTASDGKEALEKIKRKQYQLIIMDVHMPEMDGFQATKQIRENLKDVIIFGYSANVTKEAKDKSKEVGMNAYLIKPVSREKLFKFIRKYFKDSYSMK
ncbi:hybrid sensor histidine kinase/response regulator [Mangrovimonas aestuarii]|uniref:hybrid sensor histidine kinase/response regulator n=1 Tax=Mangrovimonas aestuarii TaxID=3018443 RepID=UPI002377F9A5|nr:ATP-binding protein [Mangrovimonas aestuarii]